MRRSLIVLVLTAGLISFAFWWTRGGAERTEGADPLAQFTAQLGQSQDTARPLSPGGLPAPGATRSGQPLYDPLVIGPCHVTPFQEQEVSSQVEGTLQEVHADLGQQVKHGQMLARLDERLLRPQVESLQIKAASDAARKMAQAQLDDYEAKLATAQKLVARRAVALAELQSLICQRDRYAEEVRKACEDQEVARKELEKARQSLALHQIRSALAGEVTKVYKRAGESVKPAEPLFWVANCDRLRVEGLCKVQQANLLRVGMRAVVEPELRGEQMTELTGHTGTVTGLAVAPDGRLLAEASEDRTVLLWAWPQGTRLALLPHPAEVTAVAFAPARPGDAARYHLLTGCADGRLRRWTVAASGKVEGPTVLAEGHEGAVRALAFSPDGGRFATAGEDRRLGVWDAASGARKYWLCAGGVGTESAHQGAVTASHFTPDGHLVSAGRDNTLKVWKLGEAGGELAGAQPGRTGDAPQLGVSADGRRLLFEHGEELRILDRKEGGFVGVLRSRRQGRFHGFALFSPSGRLVLSAASNGRLQLWSVPAAPEEIAFFRQGYTQGAGRQSLLALGGLSQSLAPTAFAPAWAVLAVPTNGPAAGALVPRLWRLDGYEVRHFVSPTPAPVTCGAFTPDERVAFTAGADRVIRAWGVPPATQWAEPVEAEIVYVGSQVERGTDMVRVRAELENPRDPGRRLRPGTYGYLRVYPETGR
jgi:WD40 repeat protein